MLVSVQSQCVVILLFVRNYQLYISDETFDQIFSTVPVFWSVSFPVSPVSRVFYNASICSDLPNEPDALDITLRDGNHTSCLAIPDPPSSSITVRLSRLGANLSRTTSVLVAVRDINCLPQSGLMVLASAFCEREPCGSRSFCTMMQSFTGKPCSFRCCDKGQSCGTFYLVLQRSALTGTVCEVNIQA